MEEIKHLPVGTLVKDMGRIGVITRVIQSGALNTESALINWRINYEIIYFDGSVTIIGLSSFDRLVQSGMVEII